MFYTNWGFRHLGHRYYGFLLNWEKILHNIPSLEKWYFENFLKSFYQQIHVHNEKSGKEKFLDEVKGIPMTHQPDVVRGVGMLVGAEMLFDPMLSPNYPLDSQMMGELFKGVLRESFYEGIGGGFAETMCRFLRALLLPEDVTSPLYEKMLDIEWERCHALMSTVTPLHSGLIKKGFLLELQKRQLDDTIRRYLHEKLTSMN